VTKSPVSSVDEIHMRRAILLAGRGRGRVEPNPMVGCVIAEGRRVLAEGYHRRFGGPHAEIVALRALARSDGARQSNRPRRCATATRRLTAYVTLEPCCHHGKTPPCTEALIAAGIGTVVAAMQDPAAHARGKGFRRLRSAGIDVRVGCLQNDARRENAAYITSICKDRPYVILKWAQSVDGQLAVTSGQPKAISGDKAARVVHRLRACMDGIIVGIRTAMDDDPRLTARQTPIRRVATRIVLDTRLRTPPGSFLVRTAPQTPTLVITARSSLKKYAGRAERLESSGVNVVGVSARKGNVDLHDALKLLHARSMTNVLVEGGATVLSAFLADRLADEAYVFVSPRVLGPQSSAVTFPDGFDRHFVDHRRVGHDTLFHVRFNG